MSSGSILVISGNQIKAALEGREAQIIDVIQSAYLAHSAGKTVLPHSMFLRFPHNSADRIIALPAYIEQPHPVAGVKWISSFPANVHKDMDRASAVLILNSTESGVPEAILEGSVISAKRTAASAALAARCLNSERPYRSLGVIGCGYINYEICRFLAVACPGISRIVLFDKDHERATQVAHGYAEVYGNDNLHVASNIKTVFEDCDLISFATTATSPHVEEMDLRPGSTVLHISLRDLGVKVIMSADNIVDDVDHVCRAQTSLHLAEQLTGNRNFIRGSLADILNGKEQSRCPDRISVFSPFGLGILDLALGDFTVSLMEKSGEAIRVPSFLPDRWEHELGRKSRKTTFSDVALV